MLNHKEAAKYLGINERTLTRLINENEIPSTKEGREKKYKDEDIQRLKEISENPNVELDPKIIVVAAPKGGVGKTTTVKHISKILAMKGKKVLVVDGDPQHYYTAFVTGSWDMDKKMKLKSNNLLSLLKEEKKLNSVVFDVDDNIDFISGLRKLEHYDRELGHIMARELRLKKVLAPALSKYDHIIIDTSPSQSAMSLACLMSAHSLIIPIIPDIDSLDASKDLVKSIINITKSDLSDKFTLKNIYILPTKMKKGFNSGFSKQLKTDIHKDFNDIKEQFYFNVQVLDEINDFGEKVPEESYKGILSTDSKIFKAYVNSASGVIA